ncbi:hypothetical protein [Enterobacter kobei]|uniref:hypothetical protein n=1 Tax=Enterobacter kobei TaxID=208224 RepID=UPI003CFA7CD6
MNFDLFKPVVSAVAPMVITSLLNNLVGRMTNVIFGSQSTKKRRFNKIPEDQKIDVIERISELKEKKPTPHIYFQIKLLYEKIGIYLPVWHSHKLIAFLVSEGIRMQDERLSAFLKRPLIARYSNKGCLLDKKAYWITISIYLFFAACSILALIHYGNTITLYFLSKDKNTLSFILFSGSYVIIYIVCAYVVRQIAELWKGMIFCRLFDAWLRQDMQEDHAQISTVQTLTTSDPA